MSTAGNPPVLYIRFVVKQLDRRSGRRQGVFFAASKLERSGTLSEKDQETFETVRRWFDENLEKPSRLSLSPRPNRKEQAISWFKNSANEHIQKMQEYRGLLGAHGIEVEMIKTDRPGYIVYEDEYQIAAYPFADTRT